MSITQAITPFTEPLPDRDNDTPQEFSDNVDEFLSHINDNVEEINAWTAETNNLAAELNAAVALAESYRDEAQASQNATAYSAIGTYDYPDTVIGSDGHAYRCLGTDVSGDDPVGSVTGDWVQITTGSLAVLEESLVQYEELLRSLMIM